MKNLLPTTALLLALGSSAALAQTTSYDFTQLDGQYTSLTTVLDGATFSSPSDSANQIPNTPPATGPTGEFVFGSTGGLFSTFTSSEMLSSLGYVGAAVNGGVNSTPYAPAILNITFAQAQSAVSFDFATSDFIDLDGSDYVELTVNGVSTTYDATVPSGDFYPEGHVDFTSSTPFTSISIRTFDSAGDQDLNLADLKTTAAPEPGSWALGFMGLLVTAGLRRAWLRRTE